MCTQEKAKIRDKIHANLKVDNLQFRPNTVQYYFLNVVMH